MTFVHPPPNHLDILANTPKGVTALLSAAVSDVEYLHWDQLRHRDPPSDLSHEEWWTALKFRRIPKVLPLIGTDGTYATYSTPSRVLELLHFVDQHCAGEIAMDEVVTKDDQVRHRYLVNSLMEEAIRSSQLEGAATSRKRAKQLLESGRKAGNRSEQMILNNYRAMLHVRELGDRIEPQDVLDLHRVVTEGTLDDPTAAGRLQTADDDRVAVFERKPAGRLLHQPPPAEELPDRLEAMCRFANGEGANGEFIHPVVRAIVLHFWLGYDHPFEDGNGRTARPLFYWAMRTSGYWLIEYLSISRILRQAPTKYADAYVYSETDANDTTYFVLYQLEVIRRAIEEMHVYLQRKVAEVKEVESLMRSDTGLNHRQLALLGHALRNSDARYSAAGHAASHGVTDETARTDLLSLEQRGLLERRRAGRRHEFIAPANLGERL